MKNRWVVRLSFVVPPCVADALRSLLSIVQDFAKRQASKLEELDQQLLANKGLLPCWDRSYWNEKCPGLSSRAVRFIPPP